jgi:methyl-accepting chemotaxis protein
VRLVADTNQALSAIVLKVAQIDSVMSHIATLSQEQAGRLNSVNSGVDQMNTVTQPNAVMVEQATQAARADEVHAYARSA